MLILAMMMLAVSPVTCTTEGTLPPQLTSWATPATDNQLIVGQPTRLILAGGQSFKSTTNKRPDAGAAGIAAPFTVDHAGSYEVALSDGAWVDVIEGGIALQSTAHRHGPDCTKVRKIVTFILLPGPHVLQISGAQGQSLTAAIYRADP